MMQCRFCTVIFFLMIRPPTRSTLFPYTTLFRSAGGARTTVEAGEPCGARATCTGGRAAGAETTGRAASAARARSCGRRSEEHTSELQSLAYLVCRLLLEKKKKREEMELTSPGKR